MANVVFFMFPETGHINSSLKTAKALKSRGHRVYYLQLLKFAKYICSQGLEFIPVLERCFPIEHEFCRHLSTVENLHAQMDMVADACGMTTETLLEKEFLDIGDKLEAISTQLIVEDLHSPLRVQDLYSVLPSDHLVTKIPYIILNPTVTCPPEYNEGYIGPIAINSGATRPTFILCPEQLDIPHPKRRSLVNYVEPSIDLDRKEEKFPWNQVCGDKQLIYCSLGTQSHWTHGDTDHEETQRIRKNFLQSVINVIADNPEWELILSIGNYMRAEDFHSVPSNVLLFNTVPQIKILERVSLMITAGGLNSVKECIFFGVPMIVFPCANDQYKNADCIVFHQLGLKGDIENASESSIHSYISEVLSNPVFMHNMEQWKEIFRRAEDNGRLTTMIESVLAEG